MLIVRISTELHSIRWTNLSDGYLYLAKYEMMISITIPAKFKFQQTIQVSKLHLLVSQMKQDGLNNIEVIQRQHIVDKQLKARFNFISNHLLLRMRYVTYIMCGNYEFRNKMRIIKIVCIERASFYFKSQGSHTNSSFQDF